MKKWLAPLAILIVLSSAAMAQWQVPNYSVPLGRGSGATGFKRAVPGTTGLPLTSNGAAADPTFRQPISTSNVVIHVSTAGSDSADGLSWATPKLTIQAGIDTASTTGKVIVGAGTYTLSAPVYMRAGVALECVPGATITQANSANLASIVDFSGFVGGNVATGASIRYCTLDGNWLNNTNMWTAGTTTYIIYFGNTNSVTISNNILQNSTGNGIGGAGQASLVVSNNVLSSIQGPGVFLVETAANVEAYCKIIDNRLDSQLVVIGMNGCLVRGNQIITTIIGGIFAPMVVNISGTAVTWVSGPTFSGTLPGMIIIADDGGAQEIIKTVNSTTSLTLNASAGTHTGKLAIIGHNDLLGVCCGKNVISNNYTRGGASYGTSVGGWVNQKMQDSIFSNNIFEGSGKSGVFIAGKSDNVTGLGLENIIFTGNQVINTLIGGRAACYTGGGCFHSYVVQIDDVLGLLLDSNIAVDGNGQSYTWLGLNSLNTGSVAVGPSNYQTGATNDGIYGGITTVTLSAGWGSTAATSAIVSYGHSVFFTITANGAGIAAFPNVLVNTVAYKPKTGANVMYTCKVTAGTGVGAALFNEQGSTRTGIVFGLLGTPVAGTTYQVVCQ